MGVPVTFLDKYCPEQFDIIWQACGNTRASAPKEILDEVGYTRDIYSHFLKEDSKPSIADDYNMRRYIFALRKYLICCMLNTLGLENDQISTIFRKSDNYYLDSVNRIYPQRTKE